MKASVPAGAVPSEEQVLDALREVIDPEAGMNIVDLGLIYGVEIDPVQGITVTMTMTSAACPMADMIVDEVHAALGSVRPPSLPVQVDMVWDPPWTPERMSGIARDHFGWVPR